MGTHGISCFGSWSLGVKKQANTDRTATGCRRRVYLSVLVDATKPLPGSPAQLRSVIATVGREHRDLVVCHRQMLRAWSTALDDLAHRVALDVGLRAELGRLYRAQFGADRVGIRRAIVRLSLAPQGGVRDADRTREPCARARQGGPCYSRSR